MCVCVCITGKPVYILCPRTQRELDVQARERERKSRETTAAAQQKINRRERRAAAAAAALLLATAPFNHRVIASLGPLSLSLWLWLFHARRLTGFFIPRARAFFDDHRREHQPI